jgi:hypothetical protein
MQLMDLWDGPAQAVSSAQSQALQGAWQTLIGRRPVELLISGHHLTAYFADGEIYMGSFTLGEVGGVLTLDVRVEEGPTHHRGLVALGICAVDGDQLRWCTASPGQAERPVGFEEADPRHLNLVLRRERRHGKQ